MDDNGNVYVACHQEQKVITIHPSDNKIASLNVSSVCTNPLTVSSSRNGKVVYVFCSPPESRIIAIRNGTISTLDTASQCTFAFDIFTVDEDVYTACVSVGIVKINSKNFSVIANTTQCSQPRKIAVNNNTGVVYASCAFQFEDMISIDNGTIKPLLTSQECSPRALFVDDKTGDVYIACTSYGNSVLKMGPQGNFTILRQSHQCRSPLSIFASSVNDTVYIACWDGIIALKDGMTAVLTVGGQCLPSSISVDEKKGIMYAVCSNGFGNMASVISIDLPPVFLPPPVSDAGLSDGSIAGIVIGVMSGLALLFFVICYLVKRSQKPNTENRRLVNS
jgi:DNA-binding beta-propeller fold protein YncE